jgi:hypothetical protein
MILSNFEQTGVLGLLKFCVLHQVSVDLDRSSIPGDGGLVVSELKEQGIDRHILCQGPHCGVRYVPDGSSGDHPLGFMGQPS